MRLIHQLFVATMIVSTVSLTASADSLPHRQRRMALSYIATTPTGADLLEQLAPFNWAPHAQISFIDLQSPSQEPSSQFLSSGHLLIHAQFLASSSVYMSWIFARALVKARFQLYAQSKGVINLPHLMEVEQWGFLTAMQVWSELDWQELGPPETHDYANHEKPQMREVARRLELSTSQWQQAWSYSELQTFLDAVAERFTRVEGSAPTIAEYISQPDRSRQEVAVALKIKELWDSYLESGVNGHSSRSQCQLLP